MSSTATSGSQKSAEQMTKKPSKATFSVILDTSFLIRLLNTAEPLHANAQGYFRYFSENDIPMYCSTISIAEYCVKGTYDDLPFRSIRILPFNTSDAKEAGKFAATLFNAKRKGNIQISDRLIIPNDTKIFAQGSLAPSVQYFVTADVKSKHNIEILRRECNAQIEHLDISIPHTSRYGMIDFDSPEQ